MRVEVGGSVDLLSLAALADLAIPVSGQCFDDEVACIPCGHGMALGMIITDGHRADAIVMAVTGVERHPDGRRAVNARSGVLDAYRNPDSYPGLVVSASGTDTVDTRNAEYVDTAGRRGRWQGAEGKHTDARSDEGNAAQHGRISSGELIYPEDPGECRQDTTYDICR